MKVIDARVGRALASARIAAKLSQEQLAHQAGLHPTYISQVERGRKSPTIRAFAAIASALGMRPSALLHLAETAEGKDQQPSGATPGT